MRLPPFLMRLWSRLTGSVSVYVQEPTPEDQKAMMAAAGLVMYDIPEVPLTGTFDVND